MALDMTIADNQNGTGAVATISGSAGGSANSVYVAPWTGQKGSKNWTLGGTRTGDGTVALSLTPGYYVYQLLSDMTLGPIAYRRLTDANSDDPVHLEILNGLKLRADELDMTGIDSTKTLVAWLPRAIELDQMAMPLIWFSPAGFEVDDGKLTGEDDFLYPSIIAIAVRQKGDSVANLKPVLKWREQLLRAITAQRVPGVQPSMWALPKMMSVIDPQSYTDRNILLSVLGFGIKVRQTRGLT